MKYKKLFYFAVALIIALWYFYPPSLNDLTNNDKYLTVGSVKNYYQKEFGQTQKQFPNDCLIFLTPWNKKGFDFALKHSQKIQYVSPVWFEWKLTESNELIIDGEHNVDQEFLLKLKETNNQIKIIPRIYIPGNEQKIANEFSSNSETVAAQTIQLINKWNFDGILFDSPFFSQISYFKSNLHTVFENVSSTLHNQRKLFILSIMANDKVSIAKPDMKKFLKVTDKLLVCTYDYQARSQNQFPLSPLSYVAENIDLFYQMFPNGTKVLQKKLMMGIQFYGYLIEKRSNGKHAIDS